MHPVKNTIIKLYTFIHLKHAITNALKW